MKRQPIHQQATTSLFPFSLSLSLLSFLLIFFISIFLSFISCEFERKERKKIIK